MTFSPLFRSLIILIPLATLSACAAAPTTDSGLQSTNVNLGQNSPAVYVQANPPGTVKQIITQYVPVPMPGQLMPEPSPTTLAKTPAFSSPTAAVDYANQQATAQPTSSGFFNSMMTYNYTDGSLYTIYCAPLKITDVALQPGEKLISEAAGDTLRWQIAQTYSGSGDTLTQHILIKPNQSGLNNTVIITTDQRVYHLVLQSTDSSYMAAVNWNYPNNMVTYASSNASPLSNPFANAPSNSPSIDLNKLDFNYAYSLSEGSKPDWYPVRIFNDGRQTYIQLPATYTAAQMPVLYVADNNGNYGTMVNWRYRSPYIITDVVLQKARLQTGVEKTGQTIVQIQHNEG
ncbi:MAG: P-type conjugative transfer protein TrbG [Gammaproteobacteria bacterium]|nr:P-type conjugative transfer protein TrbG [Gammaproteobacteria bacterium]